MISPPSTIPAIRPNANCNFYATPDDHARLLDWLFADATCHVYELASDFDCPLRRFHSTDEVLSQFERCYPNGKPWHSVYLQLYVPGAGPPFDARRIELDPNACDGARFRCEARGWGLVQLYLLAPSGNCVQSSHTNYNSLTRAQVWASVISDLPEPAAWDFQRISSFSSRLNRQIRKQSVGKLGSRVVLPGAFKCWEQGISLLPYFPRKDVLQRRAG